MSRLYDRIMRKNTRATKLISAIHPIIINGSNVADYCYQGEGINLLDIPNIAPPFNVCFVEFRTSHWTIYSDKKGEKPLKYPFRSMGFLISDETEDDDPGWEMGVTLFPEFRNGLIGNLFSWRVVADSTGRYDGHRLIGKTDIVTGIDCFVETPFEDGDSSSPLTLGLIGVALTVFGFMHSKNVELIEETPPPKLSKSHKKKYGNPLVSYKVLKVHSMRKEREREVIESDDNRKGINRLHIARGHFKDYRDGTGLFGKHQDIYWWDQHVRGNAKRGVIVKDYDVQAPQDNPND